MPQLHLPARKSFLAIEMDCRSARLPSRRGGAYGYAATRSAFRSFRHEQTQEKGYAVNCELTYSTIRQEILDQKKCQFQLFGVAVTVTSAILAYAAGAQPGRLVYVAPVLINVIALWMVLDKAVSIQRNVGYLQFMEQTPNNDQKDWKWETDL